MWRTQNIQWLPKNKGWKFLKKLWCCVSGGNKIIWLYQLSWKWTSDQKLSFQTNDQPGAFKCARARCKTCPFIHNANKISGPKRSIKITDHFTCTSANVIYCITCAYCKKIYIGETGWRLGDRFREHLRDVERNDKDASKPVARHFNLPNHSKQHTAICGLSLHLGSSESRKTLEQNRHSKSHSTNLFMFFSSLCSNQ